MSSNTVDHGRDKLPVRVSLETDWDGGAWWVGKLAEGLKSFMTYCLGSRIQGRPEEGPVVKW